MPWGVAAAAVGAAGGIASANAGGKASSAANLSQMVTAGAQLGQQSEMFNRVRELLQPYVGAGWDAVSAQRDLIGLNGAENQGAAINSIQNSPQFNALINQGENALRQNASATGGLRGGNFQGALAQFRPSMLSAAISDQYARLGGLTSIGQNAAAGVGNASSAAANNSSNILGTLGASNAANALAQGRASQQSINSVTQGLGAAFGALGPKVGSLFGSTPAPGYSGQFQAAPMGETYA